MWIDHVEQCEANDQEDWNIDCFGRTAKCKGEGKVKGEGKKGKGGDGDASKGGFKGKCYWCEEQAHGASECLKMSAFFRCTGENNKNQVEEDDQERHDQPEEETDMGTFDVCALEDVEESRNDASKSTMSKITATPATGLTPEIKK